MSRPRTAAVVGGGLAGLAAALDLTRAGVAVTVYEGAGRLGGKVGVSEVGGLAVDEGADAMLARVPHGVDLATEVGLGPELVSPVAGQAHLWSRGRLRPLPAGTLLGIPGDLRALGRSGVLGPRALARLPLDHLLPGRPLAEDVAVGALVTRRLGREVTERLVDPLLGGVYAGHADALSLFATVPALAGPTTRHGSLLAAVAEAQAVPPPPGPVFRGLPGGMGRLPAAVAAAAVAAGAQVRLSTPVRALERTPYGWRVVTGSAAAPVATEVDAVLVAVPAAPAAHLLPDVPDLAGIDYASVALVTLVLDGPAPGTGSGYLVPAAEGRTTKAVTFTSRKWGSPGPAVVRASVGRHGEERDLQRPDAELVAVVLAELREAVGPLAPVLDSRVTRWGGGLPQYAVGHVDRVRRIRAAVAATPGLAVAGAAYDGVGVPAVVRSGREAAALLLGAQ